MESLWDSLFPHAQNQQVVSFAQNREAQERHSRCRRETRCATRALLGAPEDATGTKHSLSFVTRSKDSIQKRLSTAVSDVARQPLHGMREVLIASPRFKFSHSLFSTMPNDAVEKTKSERLVQI